MLDSKNEIRELSAEEIEMIAGGEWCQKCIYPPNSTKCELEWVSNCS